MTAKLRVIPDPMILTPMQRITSHQQIFDFQRQVQVLAQQALQAGLITVDEARDMEGL